MPQVVCNTTAAKEHVSEAEWNIRTIKEQTRGIIGTLPFEYIPRQLKMEIIYILCRALAQRFPGEVGNIKCPLATRITRTLEAGLCKALPHAPRDVF